MVLEKLDIHINKILDVDLFTRVNSKCITKQNIKCKTITSLDDIGDDLGNLGFGDNFIDITPKTQSTGKKTKL